MKILKMSMAGLFIAVLFCGIIVLPEYMMDKEDEKYIEKYNLYERDIPAYMLSSLSVEEKLEILSLGEDAYNVTQILTIDSLENLGKSDKALLDHLSSNLKKMEQMDIIPQMDTGISWEDTFYNAELYNLSTPENSGIKVLQVWYLEFYDRIKDGFQCSFLMDANTYQVYEVSVRGYEYGIYDYRNYMWEKVDEMGSYSEWANYWLSQYARYLIGDNADVEVDVIGVDDPVEADSNASAAYEAYGMMDERMDYFNALGYLQMGDITYEIRNGCYADTFYFYNTSSNRGILIGMFGK